MVNTSRAVVILGVLGLTSDAAFGAAISEDVTPTIPLGAPEKFSRCDNEACFVKALSACQPAVFRFTRTLRELHLRYGKPWDGPESGAPLLRVLEGSWPVGKGCVLTEQQTRLGDKVGGSLHGLDGEPATHWSGHASGAAALAYRKDRANLAAATPDMEEVGEFLNVHSNTLEAVLYGEHLAQVEQARQALARQSLPLSDKEKALLAEFTASRPLIVQSAFVPKSEDVVELRPGHFVRVWTGPASTSVVVWADEPEKPVRKRLTKTDGRVTAVQQWLERRGKHNEQTTFTVAASKTPAPMILLNGFCKTPVGGAERIVVAISLSAKTPGAAVVPALLGRHQEPFAQDLTLPKACAEDPAAFLDAYETTRMRQRIEQVSSREADPSIAPACVRELVAGKDLARAIHTTESIYYAEHGTYSSSLDEIGFAMRKPDFQITIEGTPKAFVARVRATAAHSFPGVAWQSSSDSMDPTFVGDPRTVCNTR